MRISAGEAERSAVATGFSAQEGLAFAALGGALALYYVALDLRLAAVGALLFVGLVWWRLHLALLWAIFTAPFYLPTYSNPLPPKQFDSWSLSLVEFVVLACFAAWTARTLAGVVKQRRGKTGEFAIRNAKFAVPPFSVLPAVFFFVAATLSLATTEYLKVALREYRTVVLEPLLFYVMLVATVRERRTVWWVVHGLLVLGVVVAAYSLYHYAVVGEVETTGGAGRALAIYHSPNALALLLARLAALALALAWWPTMARHRAAYAAAGLLMLVVIFLTYSRGAWLGLLAAALLVAALQGWRRLAAVAAGAGAVAVGLVLLPLERLLAADTVARRLVIWQSALAMLRDHPLAGVGLDNFLYYYRDGGYLRPEAALEPDISHPHNLVLDWWLRLGLLGLVALAWLQWSFWRRGLRLYRRLAGEPLQGVVVGLLAVMAVTVAHGLIDNSYFLVDLALLFWATFGLVQSLDWLID